MKRRPPPVLLALLVLGVLLACSSCSHAAPRLDSISLRLVYRAGGVERLSFFALAADDDGFLDLEELHLLNDDAQLYWSLSSKDWIKVEKSGETWIGSHSIAMAGDQKFPRGGYRAVLVDKGGDRVERTVPFNPPDVVRAFPSISVSGGKYKAVSTYPKNSVLAYDATGALAKTVALKASEGPLADLELAPSIQSIALWAEDEDARTAALTDPVALKGR